MRRKTFLLICLLFGLSLNLIAWEPKGPLKGKNYYLPFLPFYSFPGLGAAGGEEGTLSVSISQYYIQDIVTEFHLVGSVLVQERFIDYEGFVFESTVSYHIWDNLELGLTGRIHGYYGGIFDSVFEWFHELFDFPNGGREYYPKNDVYINLVTNSGIDLKLTKSLFSIGDTDFYSKWNLFSLSWFDLSLFSALKIPTGSMENISGSGYGDLGFSLISDFYIHKRFNIYLENGVILPGQLFSGNVSSPPPVYHLMSSFEFLATPTLSFLVQFKLNTSIISEGAIEPENIGYSVKLVKPMTNIQFGAVWTAGKYRMQFYIEEDPFTNNGADLIANFTVSRHFPLF